MFVVLLSTQSIAYVERFDFRYDAIAYMRENGCPDDLARDLSVHAAYHGPKSATVRGMTYSIRKVG